jgi:hypothetical protein
VKLHFLKGDRGKVLAGLLLALLAAAGIVTGREKPAVEVREPRNVAPPAAKAAPAPTLDLSALQPREAAAVRSDPFAPRSFKQPAPHARARAEAPPSAPPLPFKFAGRLTQDGKTEVFVLRGEEMISIAPGHKIDDEYRVEAVSDTSIAFTYLPLKTRQSLELEETGG